MSRIEDPRTDVNHLAKCKLQLWNNGMADTLYIYPGIRESIACLFTSSGSIYARNGMLYTVLQYMYSTYKCVMLHFYTHWFASYETELPRQWTTWRAVVEQPKTSSSSCFRFCKQELHCQSESSLFNQGGDHTHFLLRAVTTLLRNLKYCKP